MEYNQHVKTSESSSCCKTKPTACLPARNSTYIFFRQQGVPRLLKLHIGQRKKNLMMIPHGGRSAWGIYYNNTNSCYWYYYRYCHHQYYIILDEQANLTKIQITNLTKMANAQTRGEDFHFIGYLSLIKRSNEKSNFQSRFSRRQFLHLSSMI